MKSRFFGTAVVGLVGAIVGSFSMMLFASTHFANVAGPNNTPPAVSAAPLINGGTSDQDRIVNAVKRVEPAVVAIDVTINGTRVVPADPFSAILRRRTGGRPRFSATTRKRLGLGLRLSQDRSDRHQRPRRAAGHL